MSLGKSRTSRRKARPAAPSGTRKIKPVDLPEALRRAERFRRYYVEGEPDACWGWTGGTCGRDGRGVFSLGPTGLHTAPRVAWAIANRTDPGPLFVLHSCDNARCVNPAHLLTGSAWDNMDDMIRKGRDRKASPRGESAPNVKLTESDVREIRRAFAAREATQEALAARFGVCSRQVWMITSRRSWAHLDQEPPRPR